MSEDVEPKGRVLFGLNLVDFLRTWGAMESALDGCIAVIYRYHDGRAISTHQYATIERKLSFLKAAAKRPTVVPYASLITDIHRLITDNKGLRNHLVHGFPIKIEPNGTGYVILVRPNFEEPEHILKVVRPKDWERLTDACYKGQALCTMLLMGLLPEDVRQNEIKNAGTEWLIKGAETLPASKKIRDLYKELFTLGATD